MNLADIEVLENRVKRFMEGERTYIEHLQGLQAELRQMRKEIEAVRREVTRVYEPRWDEIPDEAVLAHPEAKYHDEWEGV